MKTFPRFHPLSLVAAAVLGLAPLAAPPGTGQEPPIEPSPPPTTDPPALVLPEETGTAPAGTDLDAGGSLVIEARGLRPPAVPHFFSARASTEIAVTPGGWQSESTLFLTVLQGKPEVFTLLLQGDGEISAVEGEGILDWAVRRVREGDSERRLLEIRPARNADGSFPSELRALVRAGHSISALPVETALPTFGPGRAVGFSSTLTLQPDRSVDLQVIRAEGLVPVDRPQTEAGDENRSPFRFQSIGESTLIARLSAAAAARPSVELRNATLEGTVDAAAASAAFVLTGEAHVTSPEGGTLDVLSGHAALAELPDDDSGFRARLVLRGPDEPAVYRLEFPGPGTFPVRLAFQAAVLERDGWAALDFTVPAGAVVPVRLDGFDREVRFDPSAAVLPTSHEGSRVGFLPADGRCTVAWQAGSGESDEGRLFFSTEALVEIRISAGLLRQATTVDFRLLQGVLDGMDILLEGPGEILSVEGGNVLGWSVVPSDDDSGRVLHVDTARPVTGSERIVIRSQSTLGSFPATVAPLRLSPQGAVRHSGHVRILNEGAVRLDIASVNGMIQLAPEQFPGDPAAEQARQVFVYRFPSSRHSYEINADQILPEVGVSQILVYRMTETDRVIMGQVELEIREAPVRAWEMRVPEGFAVVGVDGAEVADFVAGSEVTNGTRSLEILFANPVEGRQLVNLRLERNIPAAAGPWTLPVISHPSAKSVRGHVGVAVSPGYRISPGAVDQLSEVPLAYFPAQSEGLQQAFRIRAPAWSAEMNVEALAQNVQADVFHLYSLKEGIAYASILVNYFVVGAPALEWRLEVPPGVGNLAVEGQNVQGWSREENEIVVALHQPTLGAATLLLTFEQPMSARGGAVTPGEVRPVGVQGERGFVQVVSPSQVRHQAGAVSPGLLEMEALELPPEYRLLSNAPSLVVYQYSSRPFELRIDVDWFDPAETAEQVVDFAALESRISRDGQVVTEARFFVKSRGRQALRLTLPPDTELWETHVDGQPVSARIDGDATLVPLASHLDPEMPVQVLVRLGRTTGKARSLRLTAPIIDSPALFTRWEVSGDHGRLIVPAGPPTPALTRPPLAETGYEWMRRHGWPALALLLAAAAVTGAWIRRSAPGGVNRALGILAAGFVAIGALVLAAVAADQRRTNRATLEFVAPVTPPGEPVTLTLRNLPAWEAMISWPGVAIALLGLAAIATALVFGRRLAGSGDGKGAFATLAARDGGRWLAALGWLLLAAGVLAQRGGAIGFWILFALLIYAALLHGQILGWWRHFRRTREAQPPPSPSPSGGPDSDETPPPATPAPDKTGGTATSAARPRRRRPSGGAGKSGDSPGPAASGAASLILALGIILGAGASPASTQAFEGAEPGAAAPPPQRPSLAAESSTQTLRLEAGRLRGTMNLSAAGRESDTLLLIRSPATLTSFEGDGLRVTRVESEGTVEYWLVLERDGAVSATAAYELAVPNPEAGIVIPTGPAAVQTVEIRYAQPGWEFGSPSAVKVEPLPELPADESGARLVLSPRVGRDATRIELKPRTRDLSAEDAEFFAETANLFVPGPGVVDGRHRVTIRPSRGQLREIVLNVPEGFTVSDVPGAGIGVWRFDPEARTLRVEFASPVSSPFDFIVETQQGTEALPSQTTLAPLGVPAAERQVGTIAIAFGADAQADRVEADGLTRVNLEDFDSGLVQQADSAPAVVLHQVYRYGEPPGSLVVSVVPVQPEVRVVSRQTLSIGDERLVLAADLDVEITRAGIFRLGFALPPDLELESASGAALSHWTESRQEGTRIVTLHLAGRTLGRQSFSLTLAGPAPGPQPSWEVPRLVILEATRESGQLLVVPEQGLRVLPAARSNASQVDARTVSGDRPGTLAFRLLQTDWSLALQIEALAPWVTSQSLQETTVREGITRTRLAVAYRIENAAVKALRIRLPDLTEAARNTVRVSGEATGDIAAVPDQEDLWEVRFQRRMLGNGTFTVDWQSTAGPTEGVLSIAPATLPDAGQASHWVAVRVSGHLEVQAAELGRGWQPADWNAVPGALVDPGDRSVPALAFRAVSPDEPLVVRIQRHAAADALALRVGSAELTSIFSAKGPSLTEARLQVEVVQKGAMRMVLPPDAELFSVLVNGQSASLVREGDAHLFHVFPREVGSTAEVEVVWSSEAPARGRRIRLSAPRLDVPLQNITWKVVIPDGFTLADADGTLELRNVSQLPAFGLDRYREIFLTERQADAEDATRLLENAHLWKNEGRQDKAVSALSRLSRSRLLDEATNEDARVQLRELQTEQAVVGLNTRRQKLYLDNRGEDPSAGRNEQLEQAANRNPLLQGQVNYHPGQVEELLLGNTLEENSALKRIASRLVGQQLAAEPALQSLGVTLPSHGRVATFSRAVQVDGAAPLELNLAVSRTSGAPWWFAVLLLAGLAAAVGILILLAAGRNTAQSVTVQPE